MTESHRNLVATFAAMLVCLVSVGALRAAEDAPTDPDSPVKAQLDQAIEAVAAAAKTNIAASKSDQKAIVKLQSAIAALSAIGKVGDISTDEQTDKLLTDLEAGARPAVLDAIVQAQFTTKLAKWDRLSDEQKNTAATRFVDSVKKGKVTMQHAMMLQSLTREDNGKVAADTINALLPQLKESEDAMIKRYAGSLEGVARRLSLIGKPIEMEGKLLDGSTFDWNSYRGKVVLIDFHASWCGPCRAEVPNVLKAHKGWHDKGFEVVGVNMDTDPKLAEKYQEDTGAKFPTIYSDDPEAKGWKAPLAVKYGINAIPCVMLVDKDGNVVSTEARGKKLAPMLEKLLGPPVEGSEVTPAADKSSSNDKPAKPAAAGGTEREAALRAALLERIKKVQAEKRKAAGNS